MFKLNGKLVSINQDLTVGEGEAAITYPAASLQDADTRAQIGIVEEPDLPRPDDSIYWVTQNDDGTYTAIPKDKEVLVAQMWERIKAKRDQIKGGGVKVGTKWYHTDPDSRIQHLGLKDQARDILAAGGSDSSRLKAMGQDIAWKTLDGSFIFLTVKHAFDIVAAVSNLDAAAFAAAEAHRAAMAASDNPMNYDFCAGWPVIYEGSA